MRIPWYKYRPRDYFPPKTDFSRSVTLAAGSVRILISSCPPGVRRLRDRIRQGKTRGNLVEFHTDHKFLLLAHGRTRYAELGALVAHAKELPLEELYGRYLRLLLETLRLRTTPAKCADVLMHMMGHFRPYLTSDEKQKLLEAIDRHRNRLIPLVVPVTLIRHYVRKYDVPYLERQVFLNPHPVELMLRNPALSIRVAW